MKKTLLSAMIAAGVIAISQNAMAADGTITFNGNITAQTCTINGNGSGSKDFTITLPTVSSSTLASAGQTAGRTPFNIALTNCTPNTGNVHAFFEAGPTTDATTGRLILNAGGATNVQLGLLNSDFTEIKAGFADASQNSKSVAITSGSATLPYYVQYVATGTASAGAANSSVLYTIAYQ
ncbi:fimbrial protein [Pseudogulbenkiania subflava]|uniref:Major type 1 subunit fimbrin (Pilin) n=1 Tax=Pseudogulbenkiania subflava DSM 22618 TaxID=1123014 RepID=A0A1Y6CB51_9NEIS|nr:fimbrial protein [Pseudogulbenkiania subflava]SMF53009.1 major type 1 subunit fimbrin (pilin) [Pseudogulbenkiania subflava DSM 22618]